MPQSNGLLLVGWGKQHKPQHRWFKNCAWFNRCLCFVDFPSLGYRVFGIAARWGSGKDPHHQPTIVRLLFSVGHRCCFTVGWGKQREPQRLGFKNGTRFIRCPPPSLVYRVTNNGW